ncbi:alpha/beta fold hydrolase [Arthrobacter sp. CAN_A1]|uniref:alpha/beta fold hydrolase n=1 Tax=Arthrobacter sp. CAN_A1 TaxID=2787717 RepID=UPI0018CA421A
MTFTQPEAGDALTCRLRSNSMPGAGSSTLNFVMVHGIGMSHRYFDRLQSALADHGNTHVLDLPGFGGNPKPGQQLGVDAYAAALGGALDQAGVRSCVLIGHSMGAQFVTELAVRRPDLVTDLVLIGPVTDPSRRSAAWHSLALGLDSLMERPLTNAMVMADYARCGLPWYFTELPVMLNYSIHERLPLAPQPVLVIRGSNDPVSRRPWCLRLTNAARDGRLVEIPGQPHVAHRGGAKAVTQAILAFLQRVEDVPSVNEELPVNSRKGPRAVLSRVHTVLSRKGAGAPSSDITDFHSITIGDRECRAYPLMHTGVSTAGSVTGDPTAQRTFVFIHGIGMSHRYFTRLSTVLAEHGDTYLIDLPGYGWTGRPAKKLTNPANAELIGTLLDDIGVGPCVVVGHSMGVQSATEMAISRPDLVSSLVLIGAAVDAKQRTILRQAPRLAFNSALEKPLLNSSQFLDVVRCGPRWYITELAVAMAYRLEERLPMVKQAVLVMRGTRDPIAGSRWSRSLAESALRGDLLEIEGSPHAVHHSAPEAVGAGIIDFVLRNEPLVASRS